MAHNCHSNSKLLTAQTKIFTPITNNSHTNQDTHNKSKNTHSTSQNIHNANEEIYSTSKWLTAQTKMLTAKGEPDFRPKDPWISRTLKTKRSSLFKIKNLLNANGVIKILRSLYGAQSSGWERENRQDFNMTTLQTFDKSLAVIPVEILIRVSNFLNLSDNWIRKSNRMNQPLPSQLPFFTQWQLDQRKSHIEMKPFIIPYFC